MVKQNLSGSSLLRIAGGFIAVFSVAMTLLVLFVIPGACSFLGGLQLLILGFLFIIGGLIFFLGTALSWKKRKVEANPKGALE